MGDQIKQTFQKLKAFWMALSPKIKKLCIFGFIGLLVLAIALTVFLNAKAGKYTILFPELETEKAAETMQQVREAGYEVRMNGDGKLEVRTESYENVLAWFAQNNYSKSVIGYDLYDKASGLTATDADKRVYAVQDLQNRLQSTIMRFNGVNNVVVTLTMPETNVKIWEKTQPKGSASVALTFEDDIKYTPEQVSSIKWLVAAGVGNGMKPEEVIVTDVRRSLTLKGVEDQDPESMDAMAKRLELEAMIEEKYEEKARNVLSIIFEPENFRVSSVVKLDYDKVVTETKTYQPSEQSTNNSGVLSHADSRSASGTSSTAQGVPGEDPNTDALPQYVNQTTDGGGYSETESSADYLVSYILEQVERDPAKYVSASISVALKADDDTVDQTVRDSILENVSKATGVDPTNIFVMNYALTPIEDPDTTLTDDPWYKNPQNIMMIGAGVLVFLLLLIIILVLVGRAKKRKQQEEVLEAATADVIELQEEDDTEFNLQQELEERKRQLRESSAKTADEAIADEVRDFAKNNPEITANLLRAWMKEEID